MANNSSEKFPIFNCIKYDLFFFVSVREPLTELSSFYFRLPHTDEFFFIIIVSLIPSVVSCVLFLRVVYDEKILISQMTRTLPEIEALIMLPVAGLPSRIAQCSPIEDTVPKVWQLFLLS